MGGNQKVGEGRGKEPVPSSLEISMGFPELVACLGSKALQVSEPRKGVAFRFQSLSQNNGIW